MTTVAGARVLRIEEMPIIDLNPWFSDDAGKMAVAKQVYQTCREIGFFYIKNHTIPTSTIRDTFQGARDFFNLPLEEKLRVHYNLTGQLRGYIPLRGEGLGHGGDLKEAFDYAPEYTSNVEVDSAVTQYHQFYSERMSAHNLWPEGLADFRNVAEGYLEALTDLGRTLFEIFAVGLGLPSDYFSNNLSHPIAEVRLLRYPPQERHTNEPEIGIDAHCDSEGFTILAQSEVGGIQVRNVAGDWIVASPIPGTFVVTIGDILARWTNNVLPATPHRVIHVYGKERYSIPFFFGPNFDTMISCLPPCQSHDNPARYQPVLAGEYLVRRLSGDYMDQPRIV